MAHKPLVKPHRVLPPQAPTILPPRVRTLPPPPPIGGTDAGATGAGPWDATPPDRTPDTGAVNADPYLPIILGRGRVVCSIPFNDSGTTDRGLFVCAISEGQIDSVEKIWLNGNLMPGDGTYATWIADPNHVHWYFDQYVGDGVNAYGSKVPLKTAAHAVVVLYGDIWRPWQSVWVTHGSSLDAKIVFAVQAKGEVCFDPRDSGTRWTENPALLTRHLLVKYKGIDSAFMNDTEFIAAADACDAAGFTCNLTISRRELVDQAIAEVLATCNGELTGIGGQIGIMLDQAQTGAAAFSFDEDLSQLMDPKTEWLSAAARPTRVIVTFANAAANYKQDSVTVDDPGIALGTVQVNEKTIALNGVTTGTAAHALGVQVLNAAQVLERTSFTVGWEGALLSRFSKIHLKTRTEIDDDYLVLEVNEADPGLFRVVAKPYVAGVYSGTPTTPPDPGSQPPPNPSTAPSAIRVTDASQVKEVLSSSDSTHDYFDEFQLVEYVLPANADATIDHLAVRGSEASDSQTKVWGDL
ncbi:MAG: phage tail protein, partial [Elusimicrobia bacterium]|nr:phage tail protein [Elusimicrobiota bacterium]